MCMFGQLECEAYRAYIQYETHVSPIAKHSTLRLLSSLMAIVKRIISINKNKIDEPGKPISGGK